MSIHTCCTTKTIGYGGGFHAKEGFFFPLYSGSSIWFYDHRFNEILPKKKKSLKRKADYIRVTEEQHRDPNYFHTPLYWVKEKIAKEHFIKGWDKNWFVAVRKIGGPNNQRNFVTSIIPRYPSDDSLIILNFKNYRKEIICFLANTSSIIFDFFAKNKSTGVNFSFFVIEQLPIFPFQIYSEKLYRQLKSRVTVLVFTSWDLKEFASDFSLTPPKKPYIWNENERFIIKSELDAIYAMMYGFNREQLEYILNTFYVIRNNELNEFGEFKTKRHILEAYDKFNSDPELGPLFRLEGVDLEELKGE